MPAVAAHRAAGRRCRARGRLGAVLPASRRSTRSTRSPPRAARPGSHCHVDACIGGLVLPFWSELPAVGLRGCRVTSISADLHKFGYAPKGASVLLQRGRDRQRAQYFATTRWPGYPVVNPTILGSKSAGAARRRLGDHPGARYAGIRRARGIVRAVDDGTRRAGRRRSRDCASSGDRSGRCSPSRPTSRCPRPSGSTRTTGRTGAQHGWLLQLQPGLTQRTAPPAAHHPPHDHPGDRGCARRAVCRARARGR